MPKFAEPIINVTVPVGREATLVCIVDDLGSYKVSCIDDIKYYIITLVHTNYFHIKQNIKKSLTRYISFY